MSESSPRRSSIYRRLKVVVSQKRYTCCKIPDFGTPFSVPESPGFTPNVAGVSSLRSEASRNAAGSGAAPTGVRGPGVPAGIDLPGEVASVGTARSIRIWELGSDPETSD